MIKTIGKAGLDLIKQFESCKLKAYRDQKGIWTIGWGRIAGVFEGMVISQEQADAWLQEDVEEAEDCVNHLSKRNRWNLTQNMYDACVVLTYNIGCGAFSGSTVQRKLTEVDYPAAADAFLKWNKVTVDGYLMESRGLTRRRKAERELFLKP